MAKKLTRAQFFFHLMHTAAIYSEEYKKKGGEPCIDAVLKGSPLPETQFVWIVLRDTHTNDPARFLRIQAYAEMAWEEYERDNKVAA